jgi:flagellar motor switch protein FliM
MMLNEKKLEKEKKIQGYNFKRPDRISKNQIRSLHFVLDRFARNSSSSISAYLRTVVEVSLESIEQVTYAEFLAGASDPTSYTAVSLKPLDGLAALEISPQVVFPMLDRLLGGSGQGIDAVRPMTEIEQSILQNVLKILIENLRESWRPVYAIDFTLTASETHPHMVQIVPPNEMVVHFKFQVRMRQKTGKMNLAFPTLVLEPIIHIFDQELYSKKKIVHDGTLVQQLRNVPVKVSIETGETSFPMQSLLSLQLGDTLVLDQRREWPVQLKVAGKKKFLAMSRSDSGRKAFAVSGVIRQVKEAASGHGNVS